MTTKHTPGPWDHDIGYDYGDGTDHEIAILSYPPDESVIMSACICCVEPNNTGDRPMLREEAEANARLIAAAPDLLEALQSLVDGYQKMFDVMPVAWQTYDHIAQAAIAKATGE